VAVSNALWIPALSPWAATRRGSPTAYLSIRQHALMLWVNQHGIDRERTTGEDIGRIIGVTSRGQISREARRLRQLEILAYRARRGPRGGYRFWPARAALALRAKHLGRRIPRVNDSVSTPLGRFLSAEGLEIAWRRKRKPPGSRVRRALTGPHRGQSPPHQLYAKCPQGHDARLGARRFLEEGASWLRGTWQGTCSRCRVTVERTVDLVATYEPALPRGLSPAELADPELLERRRRIAAAFAADGERLRIEVAEQLEIYRDLDPGDGPIRIDRPGQVGDVLEELRRRREDPDRPVE
jgi:hypothetical protein